MHYTSLGVILGIRVFLKRSFIPEFAILGFETVLMPGIFNLKSKPRINESHSRKK